MSEGHVQIGWHAALFDLKSAKLVGWRPQSAVVWAAIELIWVNLRGNAFEAWVRWPLRRGPRQRRVFYQSLAFSEYYFTLGYPTSHAIGLEYLHDAPYHHHR